MTASPKTEFYADRTINQMEDFVKITYKVIWWIWPTAFWICFFCLWFLPKDMQKIAGDMGSSLLTKIPIPENVLYSIALLPFWLWFAVFLLSRAVKIVRRFLLYPKVNFSETSAVVVEKKELITHRSGKTNGSYSYLIWVKHPVSQDIIKVDVEDRNTFEQFREGDRVPIKHLLTPTNIIYLTLY